MYCFLAISFPKPIHIHYVKNSSIFKAYLIFSTLPLHFLEILEMNGIILRLNIIKHTINATQPPSFPVLNFSCLFLKNIFSEFPYFIILFGKKYFYSLKFTNMNHQVKFFGFSFIFFLISGFIFSFENLISRK